MKSIRPALHVSLITIAVSLAVATNAWAEDGAFFLGANAGRAQIDNDNGLYQSQLVQEVASIGTLKYTRASLRKRTDSWWVDAGYMASPYIGLEASFFHFGQLLNQVVGEFTPTGGTKESVYLATHVQSSGPALGVLFRLPLVEHLDLTLRAADYYGRTDLTENLHVTTPFANRTTSRDSSLLAGLGAACSFGGHWSARVDYIRVNGAGNSSAVVKYNVDNLSLGLSYSF